MATTEEFYTGDGSTTSFGYSFPILQNSDLIVEVNGVEKTENTSGTNNDYSISGTNVVFNTAPNGASGGNPADDVHIFRRTNVDSAKAVFAAGSSIRAGDLNNNVDQSLYANQEQQQKIRTADVRDNAVTTIKIKDLNVTRPKIANDAIDGTKIADDSINSEHYVADSIDSEHYAPNSVDVHALADDAVTRSKIIADAVDGTKIADNSINSEHYVDGSIDHVHLANDAVDGDNIADDSINSEHYVAGSIDEEHIANLQVTRAKIANDAIDGTKIADDSIDSEHYVDRSIDTQHIGGSQVTTNELANNSVTTIKITDQNVTTNKIADLNVTNAKLSANSVDSANYVDGSIDAIHLSDDCIQNRHFTPDCVDSDDIAAGALDNEHYAAGSITSDKLNAATVITSSEQGSATTNDTSFLTSAAADARFFNISSGDTIKDGQTFPDNDTTIATTAAINDRIIDIVNDIGGFDIIQSEQHFPNTNPQGVAGQAAVLSIKAASTNLVPSGTTVTINNGNLANNANITITGVTSTIPQNFGFLVESTSTLHTYSFHRLVPNATEVTTVAGKAAEIARLGTADAVADMAILGTTDVVADMAILATNDVVADLNTLGTAAIVEDLNILGTADVVADMNTLATSANVTAMDTCATNIASINNASTNISSANNFGDQYQVASSAPSTDGGGNALAAGDLYFDTSANELRVYNGSTFQGGVTATGNLAGLGANTFTGNQTIQNNLPKLFLTDANNNSDFSVQNANGVFTVHDETNSADRLTINSTGLVTIPGNLNISGNVDGRDVSADGASLDNIEAGNIGTDVTNGNVKLTPNGTGVVEIKGAGGNDGTLQLNCSANSHGVKIKSPAHSAAASYTLTLPENDGAANEALITDGNGVLSFSNRFMPLTGGSFIDTVTFAGTNYNAFWNKPHSRFDLNDNVKITFGTSQDLTIFHNGSDSVISQVASGTGDLKILSGGAQSIECVKAGAVNIAHNGSTKLSTNSGGVSVTGQVDAGQVNITGTLPKLRLIDSDNTPSYTLRNNNGTFEVFDDNAPGARFKVDTSSITSISNHDFSNGIDVTGNITVTGTVDGVDIAALNTTVGNITTDVVSDTSPQLGGDLDTNSHHILLDQDHYLYFITNGGSSFLGKTSGGLYLQNNGDLHLRGDDVYIRGDDNSKMAKFIEAGAAELYYDNSLKLATTTNGATIDGGSNVSMDSSGNGQLKVNGNGYSGAIALDGTAMNIYHNSGSRGIKFGINESEKVNIDTSGHLNIPNDSGRLRLGASADLQIYHDGNNSYIKEDGTGNLYIYSANLRIENADGSKSYIEANDGGAVELYHNNNKKLETMADGVILQDLENNTVQVRLDTTQGTGGSLYADTANSRYGLLTTDGEWSLKAFRNGNTELYSDNNRKFTTTASGCDVMGRSVDCQMNFNNASNSTRYGGIYGYNESGTDLMAFLNSGGNYSLVVLDTGEVRTYGTVRPNVTNGSYHLGTSSNKWGDVHATTLYGDGSNLTNLPGGGKILQVVHGTLDGSFGTGSGSFQATGCSVTITTTGSNKVLVMAGGTVNNTSAGSGAFTTIYRGSTNISQHGNFMAGYWQEDNSNNVEQSQFLHTIDAPGAGTHTYQVYIYAHNGSGTAYWGYRNTGVITAMEIDV